MGKKIDAIPRQWEILRLIPRYPAKIDAQSIYQHLQEEGYPVTKRTVERDLKILSEIFPLTSDERDKPYGWSWAKGTGNIQVPAMTETEALTFKILDLHLGRLLPASYREKLRPYFEMAQQRLDQTNRKGSSRSWADKIRLVQHFSGAVLPAVNMDIQNCVFESLLKEQKIHIKYHRFGATGEEDYVVSPCAVVTYKGVIFLLASSENREEVLPFRMHRIVMAETLLLRAVPPKDFNVNQYLYPDTFRERAKKGVRFRGVFTHFAAERAIDWPLGEGQRIHPDKKPGVWIIEATVPPDAKKFLDARMAEKGRDGVLDARDMLTYFIEYCSAGSEPTDALSGATSRGTLGDPEDENTSIDMDGYWREIFPNDANLLNEIDDSAS